jgi:hypothetical protein
VREEGKNMGKGGKSPWFGSLHGMRDDSGEEGSLCCREGRIFEGTGR